MTARSITDWLGEEADDELKSRVMRLGELTAWRHFGGDRFGASNFERALVLHHLVQQDRPARILEIGTGRGLACLAMEAAARDLGLPTQITTVDLIAADEPQPWPIRIDGRDTVITASRREVWSEHVDPALWSDLRQLAGASKRVLKALLKNREAFDLVFIDGGHDPYTVTHDVCLSFLMLTESGTMLLDDFAPAEPYGHGTCLLMPQLRNLFGSVEVIPTEGAAFGLVNDDGAPRGMVLLQRPRHESFELRRHRLLAWRLMNVAHRLVASKRFFPLASCNS